MLNTPVALIIFNRPDLTKTVFQKIREAKPKTLLVIADGPRNPEESVKCEQARAVVEQVDWDCHLIKNYSEVNLGCKRRVSSGLNWVFSEVEEAIILEDDCVPAKSFFNFCETLLNHYRYNPQIMMISGDNFQKGHKRTPYSYYFSKYFHVWGWASWRRAWKYYDIKLENWLEDKHSGFVESIFKDPYECQYWTTILDSVFNESIDTWDYQWLYSCWKQQGLSIIPETNLISNIGFGEEASHTCGESPWSRLPVVEILQIKHPPIIQVNQRADRYTFDYHYGGKIIRESKSLIFKAKQKSKD